MRVVRGTLDNAIASLAPSVGCHILRGGPSEGRWSTRRIAHNPRVSASRIARGVRRAGGQVAAAVLHREAAPGWTLATPAWSPGRVGNAMPSARSFKERQKPADAVALDPPHRTPLCVIVSFMFPSMLDCRPTKVSSPFSCVIALACLFPLIRFQSIRHPLEWIGTFLSSLRNFTSGTSRRSPISWTPRRTIWVGWGLVRRHERGWEGGGAGPCYI